MKNYQLTHTGSQIDTAVDLAQNAQPRVAGKVLSDNNYTNEEKAKLAGLSNYDDTALASRVSALETAIGNINSVLEEVL